MNITNKNKIEMPIITESRKANFTKFSIVTGESLVFSLPLSKRLSRIAAVKLKRTIGKVKYRLEGIAIAINSEKAETTNDSFQPRECRSQIRYDVKTRTRLGSISMKEKITNCMAMLMKYTFE
jgi:hypothetical protein